MLTALSIQNYALIDQLEVDFNSGFTIITGETGAGKSILLGGLSLILGKRADLTSLRNPSMKCVIEAVFDISNYDLQALFHIHDLDFETQTIIRREILPSGKSRAFINDSPVNLSVLQIVGVRLIDIHSQHETMQLINDAFQFQVVDALASNKTELQSYIQELSDYKVLKKNLERLKTFQAEAIKEYDYNSFLLSELIEANLKENELAALEDEYESLNNVEFIQEKLGTALQTLGEEQMGVLSNLTALKSNLQDVSGLVGKYDLLFQRVNSSLIELDDVYAELERFQGQLDANPKRLEELNGKLATLNDLLRKHAASEVSGLIEIRESLAQKVLETENIDADILEAESQLTQAIERLDALALRIHKKRAQAIPKLQEDLEALLASLGMPNARFNIEVNPIEAYANNGKDEMSFLFSANKGGQFKALKKAASGGELSRIMLAIKSILTEYIKLPSIMFDEIDTGVSGEISNKMGDIMSQMSQSMQVFSITHLPQIAAKGHTHFKVYKEDREEQTYTNLVQLNHDQRIVEIAQMLGGTELSNSAIAHAKQLLN